jgi:hypothetical protein
MRIEQIDDYHRADGDPDQPLPIGHPILTAPDHAGLVSA